MEPSPQKSPVALLHFAQFTLHATKNEITAVITTSISCTQHN